jgi:hypothetical protein
MTTTDQAPCWQKSSHSGSGNNCVEVATIGPRVAVRDSKNPHAPHLAFTPEEWRAFTIRIKVSDRRAD